MYSGGGAGLLGRRDNSKGAGASESSTLRPLATTRPLGLSRASSRAAGPGHQEAGAAMREQPVRLSYSQGSLWQPQKLPHPQGDQSPCCSLQGWQDRGRGRVKKRAAPCWALPPNSLGPLSSSLAFSQTAGVSGWWETLSVNPGALGPHIRAPRGDPRAHGQGVLERAVHQPLPPPVSLSHQGPAQGLLPGLGCQPLVLKYLRDW